jgi:Domain of unknown function (DUF4293)
MLQRIQTIFLLLISLLSTLFYFVTFQKVTYGNTEYSLTIISGFTEEMAKSTVFLPFSINSLIVLLSLITVFLFKNRKLQMKLCSLLAIVSSILCILLIAFIYIKTDAVAKYEVTYNIYSIIPAINIVLAFIAKRFIKSDEELVRSADRIR